jgi:hypothetical protein
MVDFVNSIIKFIFIMLNFALIILASVDTMGIFGNVVNGMDILFNSFIILSCMVFILVINFDERR